MKEFYLKKYGKVVVKEVNNHIRICFTLSNGINTFISFNPSIRNTCEEEIENMTSDKLYKILSCNI